MTTHHKQTSNEMAEERTAMAARRTMNAADRTLMAWIRTALSMMSFGITIYKLLEGFRESGHLPQIETPRIIGLFLIGVGTVAMMLGTIQYWGTLEELRQIRQFRFWRPSFVIALIMSAGGTIAFIAIVYKVL